MRRAPHKALWLSVALAALAGGAWTGPAAADEAVVEALSPRVLFTISGGFWENAAPAADEPEAPTPEAADAPAAEEAPLEEAAPQPSGRGYYRAVAYRSDDNTSRLYLQQIALGDDGPAVVGTDEIEEITEAGAYITDIRPENSTGVSATPGFTAFIYLKQDPEAAQPDTWELFVDEFGEVTVNEATN